MTPPIIDFEAATSGLDHWQSQREELRRGLHQRLGHLPALPSEVQSETIDKRNHACGVIEKLRLHSANNPGIPAWFATPRNLKRPGPAVLWCHWHGGEYSLGKQELFEQKHTPQSPLQCFLEMGLSILCIDAYGFGERNVYLGVRELLEYSSKVPKAGTCAEAGWQGGAHGKASF